MGENPLKSDGKRHPSALMENANNLSKNFDASVKKCPPPSPTGWESDAILKDSVPEDRELQYRTREVRRRNKEKNKQNEKDNTRKWHIFVLTGRFCCYFT